MKNLSFVFALTCASVAFSTRAWSSASKPNSPDQINANYTSDNQHDTTAHLGGDVYFGSNEHLGIFGESSKEASVSSSTTTSKTFDLTLGSNWRKPFSYAGEFTYFGMVDVFTENTLSVPLTYSPNSNWSFTATPATGSINFSRKGSKSRTVDVRIGQSSIAGSVDYYGFNNWDLRAKAEFHNFTKNLKKFDTTAADFPNIFNKNALNLAEQIINYDENASATYYFKHFDLGVEYDKSQSAFDDSVTDTWELNSEIFWTNNLTTPLSISTSSTPGTDSTTGKPYPNTNSVSVGLTYAFK